MCHESIKFCGISEPLIRKEFYVLKSCTWKSHLKSVATEVKMCYKCMVSYGLRELHKHTYQSVSHI